MLPPLTISYSSIADHLLRDCVCAHTWGRGCVCERVKEKEGERVRQVGQVLASMDVNLCFSASMSADLHKLWRRYIKTILLPFQLVRLIPGLHYLPDTDVRYLAHTSLESQVSLGSRLASHALDYTKQFHPDSFLKV